jgi:carbon-monoxide dehydrogenase small subunit
MKQISLTVNGEVVNTAVEARTHLADFLRNHLGLTGTHLGCEQGVCGACTVIIDGKPTRSCISYAVAWEGSEVRTIEDFADDPVMQRLRDAFAAYHGLQCGFCTSGMLITARDIVRRLGAADEARIRLELSGNLCRCTGYVGIVEAIKSVLAEQAGNAGDGATAHAGQTALAKAPATFERRPDGARATLPLAADARHAPPMSDADARKGWTVLRESFQVPHPSDAVWALMQNVPDVASCMPGVTVTAFDGHHFRGRIRVKFGPISVEFDGAGTLESDAPARCAVISGEGANRRDKSRVKAVVTYTLKPESGGASTLVDLKVELRLTGMLAQFSRSGLVRDLAGRLTADFANRLSARLSGSESLALASNEAAEINAVALMFSLLWQRIRSLFGD